MRSAGGPGEAIQRLLDDVEKVLIAIRLILRSLRMALERQ
jgi:hypothetical protein